MIKNKINAEEVMMRKNRMNSLFLECGIARPHRRRGRRGGGDGRGTALAVRGWRARLRQQIGGRDGDGEREVVRMQVVAALASAVARLLRDRGVTWIALSI